MRHASILLCVFAMPSIAVWSQPAIKAASQPSTTKADAPAIHQLPVRQVILYKNGIGYFEHLGSVTGNQRVAIDFTSSQLNDVLQSLTILDDNGGRIGGVNYNSTTPLAEQLKSLSLAMSDDPTSTELFQALRGQRVEITGAPGGSVKGRLMSIEDRGSGPATTNEAIDNAKQPLQHFWLTIVAASGAVRVIELTPTLSVRPLDASLQSQLDRYLELLSSTHSTGLRHLTLDALGQGPRQLHVSYISEVPVWKSTYRIVFPKDSTGKAILQGWAVVDNTIGSDWDNVQLSLVAGAPQSFIQPLSQPLYLRRPEVPISTTAMTTPQTHEAADMPEDKAEADASVSKRKASGSFALAVGSASQTVDVSANAMVLSGGGGGGAGFGPGMGGNVGGGVYRVNHGVYAATNAINQGDVSTNKFDDFFQYTLAQPVTIHKNESAMVPILQENLPAERVTLWSQTETTPFRAIWLENTSKLTFDRGSFSIFEGGVFAGQGLLDPIHPGEKRLLSYAADQAIRVRNAKDDSRREIREVSIIPRLGNPGLIQKKYAVEGSSTYAVSNSADEPRVVVLELPRNPSRTLAPETKPAESTPSLYRFRLAVPAHQSASQLIANEGYDYQNWRIDADQDQVGELQSLTEEVPALLDKLKPIYMAQHQINEMKAQLHQLEQKVAALTADEARARENLTALKGNDAAKRFVDELNRSEDELEATRKESAALTEKEKTSVESLRQTLLTLEVDWSSTTR